MEEVIQREKDLVYRLALANVIKKIKQMIFFKMSCIAILKENPLLNL